MPCRSVPGDGGWGVGIPACLAGQSWGVSPIFGGCLQFFGGRGSPILWGGGWGVKGDPPFFKKIFGRGEIFNDFCFLWGYLTPPPGPDTGIRSMFGRYASYWNAFLFLIFEVMLKYAFFRFQSFQIFLLPANEVWGKVMVLHVCVILFTGAGEGWLPSMHHRSHDQHPGGALHPGVVG